MTDIEQLQEAASRITSNMDNLRQRLQDTEKWLEEANRKVDAVTLSRDLERARGDTICSEHERLKRQRTYDIDQQADTIRRMQNDLENAKRRLARWETLMPCGHPEAALIVDDPPHCAVCDQIAEARSETVDALDHLRTCPPNMCREGHPEIRYEVPGDSEPHGCPLCHALAQRREDRERLERFFNKRSVEVLDLEGPGGLTFRRLQEEHRVWSEHNFPGQPDYIPLLGALEELGELAHAHIKRETGIRGTPAELDAHARDSIADVVTFLANYCSARGFDFQALMEETWAKVKRRDWRADPITGGSGELSNRQSRERYTGGTHADH